MSGLLMLVIGLGLLTGALLLVPRREPPGLIASSALGLACVLTLVLAVIWLGGVLATLLGTMLGFYGDEETAGIVESIAAALAIFAGALLSVGNPRRNFGHPRQFSRRAPAPRA
jgi:hypothetical protein